MEPGDQPRTVEVDGMELHLDPDPDADGEVHTALPPRVESWRRRSVAGAILTGIGLGLKEALEPKRDEPAVMIEASGDPPTPLPVEADLGGIMPADNVVKIRPWLLSGNAVATGPGGATGTSGPGGATGTSGASGLTGPTSPESGAGGAGQNPEKSEAATDAGEPGDQEERR